MSLFYNRDGDIDVQYPKRYKMPWGRGCPKLAKHLEMSHNKKRTLNVNPTLTYLSLPDLNAPVKRARQIISKYFLFYEELMFRVLKHEGIYNRFLSS